ncbi:MAG: tRNA pseudouridine(55) synthase TruB [Planctomycetota bacterium]
MTDAPPSPVGFIVIDKPVGPTSMDVCRRIKWRLKQAGAPKRVKVGHGGTLDPLASGVLVVLVGRNATKLCDQVMAGQKRYLADVDLAYTSTTDDAEGELTPADTNSPPTIADVERALPSFIGKVMQTPPAYSAISIGGRRAYDLARAGEAPKLEARPIRIDNIAIVSYEWPRLVLDITCGKGVYIRSLARDLGAALGAGGMLRGLRRTMVGPHDIEQSMPLDDLPDAMTQADLRPVSEA